MVTISELFRSKNRLKTTLLTALSGKCIAFLRKMKMILLYLVFEWDQKQILCIHGWKMPSWMCQKEVNIDVKTELIFDINCDGQIDFGIFY